MAKQNLITNLDGTVSAAHQKKPYFPSLELSCVCIYDEETAAGGGRQNWQWK